MNGFFIVEYSRPKGPEAFHGAIPPGSTNPEIFGSRLDGNYEQQLTAA